MQVLYPRCCGVEVHKKTVVACVLITDGAGQAHKAIRSFGTLTGELLALVDWLVEVGCTHVAMESTGSIENRCIICWRGSSRYGW